MKYTASRPPAWGTNCDSAPARLRQKGQRKSENSTTLTGAVAEPLTGRVGQVDRLRGGRVVLVLRLLREVSLQLVRVVERRLELLGLARASTSASCGPPAASGAAGSRRLSRVVGCRCRLRRRGPARRARREAGLARGGAAVRASRSSTNTNARTARAPVRPARERQPALGRLDARGRPRRGAAGRPAARRAPRRRGRRSAMHSQQKASIEKACTASSTRSTSRPTAERGRDEPRAGRASSAGADERQRAAAATGTGRRRGPRRPRGKPATRDQRLRATSSQPLVWPSPQAWLTADTARGSPWCCSRSSPDTAAPRRTGTSAATIRFPALVSTVPSGSSRRQP